MTLEKQIELLKEWRERAEMYLPIMSSEDIERFLRWLEDYKQLKADYADLDNRLRTANTEIDRLQSVSSWIPRSERMPEKDTSVLISVQGHRVSAFYDAVKGVFMLTETEGLFYSMSAVTHWMPLPEPPEPHIYEAETPAKARYLCYKEIWGGVGCLPPECKRKDWSFWRFIELFGLHTERLIDNG